MATRIFESKAVVGVKAEGTPFMFDEPGAADAFPIEELALTTSDEPDERADTREHLGEYPAIGDAPATMEVGFQIPLMGSGTAGTVAHWHDLFKMCGAIGAVNPGVDILYNIASDFDGQGDNPAESYSVSVWLDGKRFDGKGGLGSMNLLFGAGRAIRAQCTLMASFIEDRDGAIVTPTGVSTEEPPAFVNSAFQIETFGAEIEEFNVDFGFEPGRIIDSRESNVVKGYTNPRRRIRGSLNPAMNLVTEYDWIGKWRSAVLASLTCGPIGPAGNQFTLSLPKIQYLAPTHGVREGYRIHDVGFRVVSEPGDAAGSEFALTVT